MDAGERPRDARNGKRDALDASQEMAREVVVEHPFRNVDFAVARHPQTEEFDGKVKAQRKLLRQFIFSDILVEIGHLHLA
jgi:hypothetical protein